MATEVSAEIKLYVEQRVQEARQEARLEAEKARNQAIGILGFVALTLSVLAGIGVSAMIKIYSKEAAKTAVGESVNQEFRNKAKKASEEAATYADQVEGLHSAAESNHALALKTLAELNAETEQWSAMKLSSGWARYTENLDVTYNPAEFYRDKLGIVHLRGLVRSGSGVLFTLPEGYRPQYQEVRIVKTSNDIGTNDKKHNDHGRVDIRPNGDILMQYGNNDWVSLDGIAFRTATNDDRNQEDDDG